MEGQPGHRLGGQDSTRGAGADAGHLVGGKKEPIQKEGMGFRCCGALTAGPDCTILLRLAVLPKPSLELSMF